MLGNFQSIQLNLIKNENVTLVKKTFIEFFKNYDLRGLAFKPVFVKDVLGQVMESKSVFQAIPDFYTEDDITACGRMAKDSLGRSYPMAIHEKFKDKIQNLDYFETDRELFMSNRMYKLLKQENMLVDFDGFEYWDLGLFTGEPSRKLKRTISDD